MTNSNLSKHNQMSELAAYLLLLTCKVSTVVWSHILFPPGVWDVTTSQPSLWCDGGAAESRNTGFITFVSPQLNFTERDTPRKNAGNRDSSKLSGCSLFSHNPAGQPPSVQLHRLGQALVSRSASQHAIGPHTAWGGDSHVEDFIRSTNMWSQPSSQKPEINRTTNSYLQTCLLDFPSEFITCLNNLILVHL